MSMIVISVVWNYKYIFDDKAYILAAWDGSQWKGWMVLRVVYYYEHPASTSVRGIGKVVDDCTTGCKVDAVSQWEISDMAAILMIGQGKQRLRRREWLPPLRLVAEHTSTRAFLPFHYYFLFFLFFFSGYAAWLPCWLLGLLVRSRSRSLKSRRAHKRVKAHVITY